MTTSKKPRLSKCCSSLAAREHLRLGWTLKHEFFAEDDDEPYEYIFEWLQESDPVNISQNSADWNPTRH